MRFFISILFLSLIFSNKIEENKKYQMGIFQPLVYNKTSDVCPACSSGCKKINTIINNRDIRILNLACFLLI